MVLVITVEKKMLPLLNEFSFLENLAINDDEIVRRLVELFYPSTKKKRHEAYEEKYYFL